MKKSFKILSLVLIIAVLTLGAVACNRNKIKYNSDPTSTTKGSASSSSTATTTTTIKNPSEEDPEPTPSYEFAYEVNEESPETVTLTGLGTYPADTETLEIPEKINGKTVTVIGVEAFKGNTFIKKVKIPVTVRALFNGAFSSCSALEEVTFAVGTSLSHIEENVFADCSNMKLLNYPGVDSEWSKVDKYGEWISNAHPDFIIKVQLFDYEFYNDGNEVKITGVGSVTGRSIIIPDTLEGRPVTGIAENAFANNSNITNIKIPASIKFISKKAFFKCSNLSEVIFDEASEIYTIYDGAFQGTAIKEISLPKTLGEIYADSFSDCLKLKKVNFLGSEAEWSAIAFSGDWKKGTPSDLVVTFKN